jgi:hypothetical protein
MKILIGSGQDITRVVLSKLFSKRCAGAIYMPISDEAAQLKLTTDELPNTEVKLTSMVLDKKARELSDDFFESKEPMWLSLVYFTSMWDDTDPVLLELDNPPKKFTVWVALGYGSDRKWKQKTIGGK